MAKIQELYDRTTSEAIYPRTAAQAVYDSEGRDLETRLAAEEKKTDGKLADYSTTDEVKGFIETLTTEISDSLASGDFGASVAGNSGFVERLLADRGSGGFTYKLAWNSSFCGWLGANGNLGRALTSNTAFICDERMGRMLATNSGLYYVLASNSTFVGVLASHLTWQSGMAGLATNSYFYNGLCNNYNFYTTVGVNVLSDRTTRELWAKTLATNSPLASSLIYYSGFYNGLATNSNFVAGFYSSLSSYNGFTAALDKKQNALKVSDDLDLTPEGALSVAEGAKREVFIDRWNERCNRIWTMPTPKGYNAEDGLFYVNGIGLTYEQAVKCDIISVEMTQNCKGLYFNAPNPGCPTLFPPVVSQDATDFARMYGYSSLEVIHIAHRTSPLPVSNLTDTFYNAGSLKAIYPVLDIAGCADATKLTRPFAQCWLLENIQLKNLKASISFAHSPKLSFDSVKYMIDNAANTTAITVTVHADVFAKLTGDTTNEAAAALSDEELAQWAQVLTDALEKNITFATI